MKKREAWSLAIACLGAVGFVAYGVMTLAHLAPAYFKKETMNLFGEISKWCVYSFVIVCVCTALYEAQIKDIKSRGFAARAVKNTFKFIDRHSLGIISLLFAVTIISVNVPIAFFILASSVSLALVVR